jgi:hypothetical protein
MCFEMFCSKIPDHMFRLSGCIIGKVLLNKIVFCLDADSNRDCKMWNSKLMYEWWTGNSVCVCGSCYGIIKLLYRGWPRLVGTPCSCLTGLPLSVALLLQWSDWGSPQKNPSHYSQWPGQDMSHHPIYVLECYCHTDTFSWLMSCWFMSFICGLGQYCYDI